MRVLLFHPVRLPAREYGGVERVVLWLAKGLVESGHEVFVAAAPGSKLPPPLRLIEISPKLSGTSETLKRIPPDIDIVHFMAPPGEELWSELKIPKVLTVHGNGKPGEVYPTQTVFLSQDHASRHGAEAFVYNGIDPAEYEFNGTTNSAGTSGKGEHFLFLSKTSWRVKNVRGALQLCKKAHVPLWIAGGNRPLSSRLRSFATPGVKWLGPVGGAQKARLLAGARALVFPVLWPEPFGLVVAESLVSGTPVIANPVGSLTELLPPDVGALPGTEDEWIELLRRKTYPWKPERMREWVFERFHYKKMTESYEAVYERVRAGESLNEARPKAPLIQDWRGRNR